MAEGGGTVLQPPTAGVTMTQLRRQMNKLQDNRITFSGKENSKQLQEQNETPH